MNQVVKFNPNAALAIPAHIVEFFGQESNIEDRVTVPSLSYEGKTWTVSANGEKTRLMKEDENGDAAPVSTMRVIILDYNKRRGRALYEGTYDPAKPGKPTCWSEDGVKAHASITEAPFAPTSLGAWTGKCEGCPMSIKGSKVSDNGKSVAACSQYRMLAVIPAGRLGTFPALRLKLSITSDWDGQSPELAAKGWFAFGNFKDYLQTKNATHTAAFVTKMTFDPNVTWPKVMFAHDRWLTTEELAIVRPIAKSDEVKGLLAGTWTVTGVDGEKFSDAPIAAVKEVEKAVTKKAIPKVEPAPPTQPVMIEDDDDDAPVVPAKVAKPATAKPATVAAKVTKPTPEPTKATPVIAAPAISPVNDSELDKLLTAWAAEDDE